MNLFSCGCGALLRELSGLPPFSSLPLPALTLCAVPHRAPHFPLCFFFFAASQPTGSATLRPPPPLFLLMEKTLAVRRRAVCALALLALLCGCCCGADAEEEAAPTGVVNVLVDVSCPATGNKLRWRVAGKGDSAAWRECPQAVTGAKSIEGDAGSNTLCLIAGSAYIDTSLTRNCPASHPADGDTNKVVAFTMNCTAAADSALHNLSKSKDGTLTLNPTDNPLGASGGCEYPTPSQTATQVQPEPQSTEQQQPAGPQQQQPANAAAASSSARTHDGDRTRNGGSTAAVGGQPGSASDSTGSQEQSAEGRRETTTPSVGTAASSAQTAGDRAAEGATTTTTRSPSDGNDAKSKAGGSATNSNATQKAVPNTADRSATSTPFVDASLLLLLLTAALACAAG
ncbi:mucin-like glycoprotein [Trypanosoma conorhini]|uniref:Mucin-like glycoprotein n=1 Tax=Trypanosoma conorhini TaxID=83891 RepID=A0A3R7JVF1_9TRYP|nr:mucin-like glycoprotein [Trypanosoma conorhini]RNE97456.1 mucin-like glycoprotein [Trypanosoma conorhini]